MKKGSVQTSSRESLEPLSINKKGSKKKLRQPSNENITNDWQTKISKEALDYFLQSQKKNIPSSKKHISN